MAHKQIHPMTVIYGMFLEVLLKEQYLNLLPSQLQQ